MRKWWFLLLAVLLVGCSTAPSGPVKTDIEGYYGGVMYGDGLPFAIMILEFEPLYDGEFGGGGCMEGLLAGSTTACNYIREGKLEGSLISFKVGNVQFRGTKVGDSYDATFSFEGRAGTVLLEPLPDEEQPAIDPMQLD